MSARLLTCAGQLSPVYDMAVIGAGPAGLACATQAAQAGLKVVLLDENARPGGQIYRSITTNDPDDLPFLGQDYWKGRALAQAFLNAPLDYAPKTTVWSLEPGEDDGPDRAKIGISLGGAAAFIKACRVVLATGAMERPMPVPGWTLPGVMTAGAAQIALKSAGIVPDGNVVLAGCGPLIYLLAAQLIDAGTRIEAVIDTTPVQNWRAAIRYFPDFLRSPYIAKGLSLLWRVRRSTKVISGVETLKINGTQKVQSVTYRTGHRERTIAADCVLLHQGVVPNPNLARAAGCDVEWNERQRSFQPVTDENGRTSITSFFVTGDGAGIGGALCAEISGHIAALAILRDLGHRPKQEAMTALQKQRHKLLRGRHFLDLLYMPGKTFVAPRDPETIICRCEEVSAGTLRDVIALGVPGPNQLKTFVRCGMGPCQGRLCALTVSEIMADELGVSPAEVGSYRSRMPVKPVRLSEIAALSSTPDALQAVTGKQPDSGH